MRHVQILRNQVSNLLRTRYDNDEVILNVRVRDLVSSMNTSLESYLGKTCRRQWASLSMGNQAARP